MIGRILHYLIIGVVGGTFAVLGSLVVDAIRACH